MYLSVLNSKNSLHMTSPQKLPKTALCSQVLCLMQDIMFCTSIHRSHKGNENGTSLQLRLQSHLGASHSEAGQKTVSILQS